MSRRTERIEGHINEVSERMASRLDILSRELDAKAIAARVMGKPDPGMGDMIDFAIEKARENPMAVAMVGIGLVGLFGGSMFGAGRPQRRVRVEVDEVTARDPASPEAGEVSIARARVEEVPREPGKVSEWSRQARRATSEAVGEVREAASGMAEGAKHYAEDAIRQGSRRARASADTARKTVRRQSVAAADWVRANPVACGLMVMATSAAIASLMTARRPPSRDAASALFKARAREREAEDLRRARRSGRGEETFEDLSHQAGGGRGPGGFAATQGFEDGGAARRSSADDPAATPVTPAGAARAAQATSRSKKQATTMAPKQSVSERVASDNAAATAHVHPAHPAGDGKTTTH